MEQQQVRITRILLEAALARSPWVSEIWQEEAKTLFTGFDEDGNDAIEVNVADSEIPRSELGKMMQACTVHGLLSVREAIAAGMELRPPEDFERDDLEAYKATLNY